MVSEIGLLIDIVAFLLGGISCGFIIYGLIDREAADSIKYSVLTLLLCLVAAFAVNYEFFLFKEIIIPNSMVETLRMLDIEVDAEKIVLGNGVSGAENTDDGSVKIKFTTTEYRRRLAKIEELISKQMDVMTEETSNVISIEPNEDYTEFEIYINTQDIVFSNTSESWKLLLYGSLYNIFKNNAQAIIYVNFYRDGTSTFTPVWSTYMKTM